MICDPADGSFTLRMAVGVFGEMLVRLLRSFLNPGIPRTSLDP